ncbi:TIM barrel protein [Chloroflexus sp.]|uniref:TIM barrel protein n=1 Tax=Chloroflexus sp. TaxID=1904827 RepID=UPI00298F281C|nr:TIM barrel protein [Chloroflexus sp.]MCS6888827.1 sugar phosphate isomerase/epimerase [Chloroflexus sp.]MDW8402965.1 TIM barrel protein [Chloroflexus sp.]
MLHLFNVSVYSTHIDLFAGDWKAVAAFAAQQGFDGIELLIGVDPLPDLPSGLVCGVHLPYWIRWIEIWRDGPAAAIPADERAFLAGGARDAADMVALQHEWWQRAARLQAQYAVFHVSHVTMAETFTRYYSFSAEEVVSAAIELLNATAASFPHGEPPVRLWLENLWWPGLTFTDPDLADRFVAELRFTNWAFVLDTGHLINSDPSVTDEEVAIDLVLARIAALPSRVRERIEGIHLNLSLSGAYQRAAQAAGLPDRFAALPVAEQFALARDHVAQIDQHRPFTSPRCREIVAATRPRVVVHELLARTRAELEQSLRLQCRALDR